MRSTPFQGIDGSFARTVGAWVLLALMVAVTIVVWRHEEKQIQAMRLERARTELQDLRLNIERRMEAYLDGLRAARGLFAASMSVERAEWRAFVQGMNLAQRYPGVKALTFLRYVRGAEKAKFVEIVRGDSSISPEGYPNFDIRPSGERGDYFVGDFIEPFDSNLGLFGLDRGAQPQARAAMEKARDSGLAVATGSLEAMQTRKVEILLLLAIYINGAPTDTVEERRTAFQGLVGQVFDVGDLFRAALAGRIGSPYHLELHDETEGDQPQLLYADPSASITGEVQVARELIGQAKVDVAGRTWGLRLVPRPEAILGFEEQVPVLLLVGGLVISLLVFGFTWSMTTSQARALQLAGSITDELRNNLEVKRTILERAPDAVVSIDTEGRIEDWSLQAESIFGWTKAEVEGLRLARTIIPERFREAHEKGLKRYLETGEGPILQKRIEVFALHRDGREIPVELTVTPVEKNGTRIFSAFVRDITARRLLETELKRSLLEAHAATTAKSEFLDVLSREARGPVSGILRSADLLLGTELTPAQRQRVKEVSLAAECLQALVTDALDFARIDSGRLELEIVEFDVRFLVKEVADLMAEPAQAKGLFLETSVEKAVPPLLSGDLWRLRQILVNLVGNAVKFTQEGGVALRASTAQDAAAHVLIRFEVEDTGMGLSPEAKGRLFHHGNGASGFGLVVAKRFAELMGGQLGVESTPGQGSVFWFTAKLGKASARAPRTPAPTPRVEVRSLRVLLAGDYAGQRAHLSKYLAGWGMKPVEANSSTEALNILKREATSGSPFTVAVLDVPSARVEGLAFARAIRHEALFASLFIVLVAPPGEELPAALLTEMGISAQLTSPVRLSQLQECLALIVSLNRRPEPEGEIPLLTRRLLEDARTRRANAS